MSKRLNVIWCDDIRQETGNKVSIMGVYQSELITHGPATMPKLCAYITIQYPTSEEITSGRVRIVDAAGNELINIPDLPNLDKSNIENNVSNVLLVLIVIISPFAVNEETRHVEVIAELDGVTLHSNKLLIKFAPNPPSQ